MRQITTGQAEAAYEILVLHAGANPAKHIADVFIRYMVRGGDEFRFEGKLGFGGKFRNNGNHDNTPYIDCYGEDLTEARRAIIQKVNAKLVELFSGA